jgi:hypothetical protein
LKGKAQYFLPPCIYLFRSAAFYNAKLIYLFTKEASFMRKSTVLSLPLQLSVPCAKVRNKLFSVLRFTKEIVIFYRLSFARKAHYEVI